MSLTEESLPDWSPEAQQLRAGIYRHYKGHRAEVLGVARHSETLEECVVYRHDGQLWVRPLAMFVEYVTVNGKTQPRFSRIIE